MTDYLGSNNWKLAAAVASGAVVGLLANSLTGSTNNSVEPKKWVRVGTVTNLILYPIKSCQGIYVEEASCEMIGLKGTASDELVNSFLKLVSNYSVLLQLRNIFVIGCSWSLIHDGCFKHKGQFHAWL